MRQRCISDKPLPLPLPFPQIFSPFVHKNGSIQQERRPTGTDVENLPVLTRLAASGLASDIYRRSAADLTSEFSVAGCSSRDEGYRMGAQILHFERRQPHHSYFKHKVIVSWMLFTSQGLLRSSIS